MIECVKCVNTIIYKIWKVSYATDLLKSKIKILQNKCIILVLYNG